MSEFASAAMIRVLSQGMRELNLDPGRCAPLAEDARVDLSLKRMLVASAVKQGGLGCLPLLGRGLHRLAHEPTHDALASARNAKDLFERWRRLERYIHSRHRCEVLLSVEGRARLRHIAVAGAPTPLPAEDLIVLGVLAPLLEAIGLNEVTVHLGRVAAYPAPDLPGLARAASQGATSQWDFRWTGGVPRSMTERASELPAELEADGAGHPAARKVYGQLIADLTRLQPLPDIASALGVPARSLQRDLSRAGWTYSKLLSEARCRAGAWWLLHTEWSIAEIGFLSGYADQPHFTRDLQRKVGMTPAAYRNAFAAGERR